MAVSAECNQIGLIAVDGDTERLLARSILVDRVQALLSQVVPEPYYTRHVCTPTAL